MATPHESLRISIAEHEIRLDGIDDRFNAMAKILERLESKLDRQTLWILGVLASVLSVLLTQLLRR